MSTPTLAALSLGPLLVTFAISTFIPWLTALVTAQTAHPGLKAVLTLALSAVTGVLTQWQANPVFDWKIGTLGALEGFAVAVLAHFGLWKPTQVTGANGGIQKALPRGLGRRA